MRRVDPAKKRQDRVAAIRWSWFDDIGWPPHRYQAAAHLAKARIKALCAGRRGGKSAIAGHEGSAYMVAGPHRVAIFAPSYDLGAKEFNYIWDDIHHEANPHLILQHRRNPSTGDYFILLENGAECGVVSTDKPKKSGHGEEYDLIILAEAGLNDNMGGEDGVWNKTIMGGLATRKGEVIIPTTPQGQDDWLFPLFMSGLLEQSDDPTLYEASVKWRDIYKVSDPHNPDVISMHWPSYANPMGFNEDPVELKKKLPPRIFQEQILGMFVRWSGSIWVNDFSYDDKANVCEPFVMPAWWNRLEVIDPGYAGMFFWLAAMVDPLGNIFIVDEYSDKLKVFEEYVPVIQQRRREFYNNFTSGTYDESMFIPVYIDPEDKEAVQRFANAGLHATEANNDVFAGFNAGGIRFKNKRMTVWLTCDNVRDGLKYHEWMPTKQDSIKRRERQDRFKHASDCVRYLSLAPVWEAEKPKEEKQELTVGELIESNRVRNDDPLSMSFEEWVKYQERMVA